MSAPARCLVHDLARPCRSCRADELAGDKPRTALTLNLTAPAVDAKTRAAGDDTQEDHR